MTFVTGADTMAQTRFVVEVVQPVPGERVGAVAARIAARFDMDVGRVRRLLEEGRTGPVTRPLSRDKAASIARAFGEAGVAVAMKVEGPPAAAPEASPPPAERRRDTPPPGPRDEETPANVIMTSTRWVPSPHEEVDIGPPVDGRGAVAVSGPVDDGGPTVDGARLAGRGPVPAGPSGTGPATAAQARRRRVVRSYLMGVLVAAFVLLLALQALNRVQRQSAAPASVADGMDAYAAGHFGEARRVWTALADAGDARAQYMLGYMAENGQGRAWSNHDAADWYGRAAALNYPQAQVALGNLYQRGMGVERDPQRAVALFRAAAREGYGPGQFQYALAFFHGSGVAQDFGEALRWFQAAAANGVADARPYVAFAGTSSGDGGKTPAPQQGGAQPDAPKQPPSASN